MVRFLLDTCAVSEFSKHKPNEEVIRYLLSLPTSDTFLSSITIGEIQRGISRLPKGTRRREVGDFLERQLARFDQNILPIDTDVALVWGQIFAVAQGRGVNLSSFDSLIAATAIHHGLHVITRNVKDFEPTGVDIVNPWNSPDDSVT